MRFARKSKRIHQVPVTLLNSSKNVERVHSFVFSRFSPFPLSNTSRKNPIMKTLCKTKISNSRMETPHQSPLCFGCAYQRAAGNTKSDIIYGMGSNHCCYCQCCIVICFLMLSLFSQHRDGENQNHHPLPI